MTDGVTFTAEGGRVVATVGKRVEPGEHVRYVISVPMLTEGGSIAAVTSRGP